MPSTAFTESLPFVLRWEGGYVNHPADPGGATNKGVTQKVYDGWRARQGLSARDVRQLEDGELAAIYENDYWLPPRCHVLQQQLGLVHFDTAVNMGVGRAVKLLQTGLGCAVDGAFGPGTQKAADSCDLGTAVAGYCQAREDLYRRNALRTEVGLPGYEAAVALDFGDTGYIAKVADDVGTDLLP
jgi:lysozyme family protein